MNILYLTRGDEVDYQNDCLLIGLKEMFGETVVDINKAEHLYEGYDRGAASRFHGKGFTVCGVLPNLEVDRSDIESKIRNRFFDFIIFGSVWRSLDGLEFILENYPTNRICFIDGEDENYRVVDYKSFNVPYFKRELRDDLDGIFPISFAFPTKHINLNKSKERDYSIVTPLDSSAEYVCAAGQVRRGYIYDNQEEYYQDYRMSRFGITCKKGGWDCLRHYEIMGNGCIPKFLDINDCPKNTMTNFPKEICSQVLKDLQVESPENVYDKHIDNLIQHFLKYNTTTSLATYVIDTLKSL